MDQNHYNSSFTNPYFNIFKNLDFMYFRFYALKSIIPSDFNTFWLCKFRSDCIKISIDYIGTVRVERYELTKNTSMNKR